MNTETTESTITEETTQLKEQLLQDSPFVEESDVIWLKQMFEPTTIKDLQTYFGVSRQTVIYRIDKYQNLGLIRKLPVKKGKAFLYQCTWHEVSTLREFDRKAVKAGHLQLRLQVGDSSSSVLTLPELIRALAAEKNVLTSIKASIGGSLVSLYYRAHYLRANNEKVGIHPTEIKAHLFHVLQELTKFTTAMHSLLDLPIWVENDTRIIDLFGKLPDDLTLEDLENLAQYFLDAWENGQVGLTGFNRTWREYE